MGSMSRERGFYAALVGRAAPPLTEAQQWCNRGFTSEAVETSEVYLGYGAHVHSANYS